MIKLLLFVASFDFLPHFLHTEHKQPLAQELAAYLQYQGKTLNFTRLQYLSSHSAAKQALFSCMKRVTPTLPLHMQSFSFRMFTLFDP